MSRTSSNARAVGRAAGQNPTAAFGVICVALWLLGYWWVAVVLVIGAVVATDVEDRLAAWWEQVGLPTRAAVCVAVLVLAYVAVAGVPLWSAYVAGGVAVLAVVGLVGRWWRLRPYRQHVRTYMEPLHQALAPEFGAKPAEFLPSDWLLGVKPGLLDAEDGIMIRLPTGRVPTEQQMERAVRAVAKKLDLRDGEYEVEWRLGGENQHLHIFRARPKPAVPAIVRFDNDEFLDLLRKGRGRQWLVGRGLNGTPFYLDPDQDNPHVLLSCLTGWGKSNGVSVILADHLHWGQEAIVLDAKYGSLPWAADLPGVTYARRVEEIHSALIRIGVESERRRRVLEDAPWTQPPTFSRLLIVVEETNTTIDELTAFWTEERARLKQDARDNGERIDLPTKSPALRVYRQLGYMGRQLRMNLIVISQRAEATAVGGSAIRDQLGTKILGWPNPADWSMHAKALPFQQSNGKQGHSFIIRVGKVWEVQWAYAELGVFREWATSGRQPTATLTLPPSYENENRSHLGGKGGSFLGGDKPPSEPQDPDASPITLRQAVEEGVIDAKLSSVQRWSRPSMPNGFPAPVGENSRSAGLYDRNALRSWWSLYRSEVVADD